jgi:hypothetical protein
LEITDLLDVGGDEDDVDAAAAEQIHNQERVDGGSVIFLYRAWGALLFSGLLVICGIFEQVQFWQRKFSKISKTNLSKVEKSI